MINCASVQLIQKLMGSRSEHPESHSKDTREWHKWLHIYITFLGFVAKWHFISTSPFLRQEASVSDQHPDTRNITSRFRANLVIAGGEAFEEDNWSQLMIGNTRFVVSWWKILTWIEFRYLSMYLSSLSFVNEFKGHRSVWKVPHGWNWPGNWHQIKGSFIVSVSLPHWEGQSTTTTTGSVDELSEKMNYPPFNCAFVGDFRHVPKASSTSRIHGSPFCWLPCSTRAKQLLKDGTLWFTLHNLLLVLGVCFFVFLFFFVKLMRWLKRYLVTMETGTQLNHRRNRRTAWIYRRRCNKNYLGNYLWTLILLNKISHHTLNTQAVNNALAFWNSTSYHVT